MLFPEEWVKSNVRLGQITVRLDVKVEFKYTEFTGSSVNRLIVLRNTKINIIMLILRDVPVTPFHLNTYCNTLTAV